MGVEVYYGWDMLPSTRRKLNFGLSLDTKRYVARDQVGMSLSYHLFPPYYETSVMLRYLGIPGQVQDKCFHDVASAEKSALKWLKSSLQEQLNYLGSLEFTSAND